MDENDHTRSDDRVRLDSLCDQKRVRLAGLAAPRESRSLSLLSFAVPRTGFRSPGDGLAHI